MSNISRRKFLKTGAAALAGITIAPSTILGMSHGHVSPTDKLNLAAVGIGGMGHANINHVKGTENIVALCDVDWKYAKGVFDEFPKAKKYWDYRKMYDEMGKSIDGVIVATADHTHAIITADAMTMGKHVYCQKPLTHSVYESRLLTKLAASTGVVTQMGNQGSSDEGTDLVCEWIWNGEIGDITKVECATDRPIWPQGLNVPEKVDKIPSTLNWDLFTGPAKMNPCPFSLLNGYISSRSFLSRAKFTCISPSTTMSGYVLCKKSIASCTFSGLPCLSEPKFE